jgi:hypothetical protein
MNSFRHQTSLVHVKVIVVFVLLLTWKTSHAETNVSSVHKGNKTIKLGYFLRESQPPYRIGAIQMAIDKARAEGLLAGYDIR